MYLNSILFCPSFYAMKNHTSSTHNNGFGIDLESSIIGFVDSDPRLTQRAHFDRDCRVRGTFQIYHFLCSVLYFVDKIEGE